MQKIFTFWLLFNFLMIPIRGDDPLPWFSGTLLAFFPQNVEPGHFEVQPNFFASYRYGIYDKDSHISTKLHSHLYNLLLILETGITEKIDISANIMGTYAHTPGGDVFHMGDLLFFLGFQILKDKKGTWIPDMRVMVGEGFPTGKYHHLNPDLELADITGTGTFDTAAILILRKIFYTWPCHPYNIACNLGIIHSSQTHVEGLNAFGGSPFTSAIIEPTERFFIDLAFEYKFNQQWGYGVDFNYIYSNGTSGHRSSADFFNGSASSYLFSIAPMIEYNVSETVGFSGGVWFSVKGRNTFAFVSGAVNFFYIF